MKYSSWPGIPVRTITCAGNNERTVGRITQHHVRTRNDVLTGCIGATLSIAKLLATLLTSCRRARASSVRITGLAGLRQVAFYRQDPPLPKVYCSPGSLPVRAVIPASRFMIGPSLSAVQTPPSRARNSPRRSARRQSSTSRQLTRFKKWAARRIRSNLQLRHLLKSVTAR